MTSSRASSMMVRRPRAPILRSIAISDALVIASSVNINSTPSTSNSFWNCFTSAFLGSTRMRVMICRSMGSTLTTTGSRPTNSGINPYFSRSSGITCRNRRATLFSLSSLFSTVRSLLKPSCPFSFTRSATISSSPWKAPLQMNRMSLVFTWMNSCWGCLRPPWGGTLATVPSIIFSSPCCTPSPDTSRVMEGLSPVLRAILSISSM